MDTTDSPDVMIAKRLLDHARLSGFTFQRIAPGEDAPLVGYRLNKDCVDLIHIEGFSRDCFAWRKRATSLIVSQDSLVQHRAEGSALLPRRDGAGGSHRRVVMTTPGARGGGVHQPGGDQGGWGNRVEPRTRRIAACCDWTSRRRPRCTALSESGRDELSTRLRLLSGC